MLGHLAVGGGYQPDEVINEAIKRAEDGRGTYVDARLLASEVQRLRQTAAVYGLVSLAVLMIGLAVVALGAFHEVL